MDHTLPKRLIGSVIVVLSITLLIAAMQFYGVIGTALGRTCLILTWVVGVAGIVFSEWLWRRAAWEKVIVGIVAAILLAAMLFWLDRWARAHGTTPVLSPAVSTQKSPLISPKLPTALPRHSRPAPNANTASSKSGRYDAMPPQTGASADAGIHLSLLIVDPASPNIIVLNKTDRVAEGVGWELVSWRESDLAVFSFATQSIGYIKPNFQSAAYSMQLPQLIKAPNGGKELEKGDVLDGSLVLDCPTCTGESYVIHLQWEVGGWFWKFKDDARLSPRLTITMSNVTLKI